MKNLDRARGEISAIIDGIERTPVEVRRLGYQPDDREAYDIVARIERRMLSQAGGGAAG